MDLLMTDQQLDTLLDRQIEQYGSWLEELSEQHWQQELEELIEQYWQQELEKLEED